VKPNIAPFFEPVTATISYVVYDELGGRCAIIDPVLDYDPKAGRTATLFSDKLIAFIEGKGLKLEWILETHVHADHLTSAHYLKGRLGGKTGISEQVRKVQQIFKNMFNLGAEFIADGSNFDHLFTDNETFAIGKLTANAVFTPGHTPADLSYQFKDAIFLGDTLFMPDLGTARADFPGGDAHQLFRSIKRLLDNPPETRLFMCHDYPPASRVPQWECTVADQRASNIHVRDGVTEDDYVAMRNTRDKTLGMPALMLPSVQINIRAGNIPPPEENGVSYLKIPLNLM
jgi:glyoxylase-like metal-dependent hydrolase (beta-lactamase superfamily II)